MSDESYATDEDGRRIAIPPDVVDMIVDAVMAEGRPVLAIMRQAEALTIVTRLGHVATIELLDAVLTKLRRDLINNKM